jgi:hypothetical protein
MWDPSNPEQPDTSFAADHYNIFIAAICSRRQSKKETFASLINQVDRQVEGLNALWYSAWLNTLESVTMFLDLGIKPTQDLISHIEDREVELKRREGLAAETYEVRPLDKERDRRMRSEILALLKAHV